MKQVATWILWFVIVISAASRAVIAAIVATENPPGNVLAFIFRHGLPPTTLALAFLLSALLALGVPWLVRRRLVVGILAFILSTLPTLYYMEQSAEYFHGAVRTGSDIALVLYTELYFTMMVAVSTSALLLFASTSKPGKDTLPHE